MKLKPNKIGFQQEATIYQKIHFVLALVMVFSLPFSVLINSIAFIFLGLNFLIEGNFKTKINQLKQNKTIFFLGIYYLINVLSLLYSQDKTEGINNLETQLGFFFLPLIFFASKQFDKEQIKIILKTFVLACFIATIYCLINSFVLALNIEDVAKIYYYFTYEKLSSGIGFQPIYFAMYLVWCFFILLWLYLNDDSIKNKKIDFKKLLQPQKLIPLIYLFIFIIMLSSRMEIMAFIFILVLGLGFYHYKNRTYLKGIIGIATLLTITISLIYFNPMNRARFQEMIDLEADYTQNKWGGRSIRIQKWLNSLEIIKENWAFGVGIGDMQTELQKIYKSNNFELAYSNRFNSHNQYIQTALGLGIVGLLAFLFCLFKLSEKAWKKRDFLLLSFVLLFAISCITESMLLRQKGLVFFGLFVAILAAED